MRILHLLASPAFTGPADAVAQLALAQRALGHQVSVAVDGRRTRITSEELALPRFEQLGLVEELGLELSVKSSPLGMLRDVRRLRGLTADVVHCHFTHDHTLARFGRPAGATLIRSIHAPRSLRWLTPAADGWTVPVDAWARRLLGVPVAVLPALVDSAFTPPADRPAHRQKLGLGDGPIIGMVSTFQRSRHHDVALAAFALVRQRAPAAKLLLVGDGRDEPFIRGTSAALGLGELTIFAGYQSGARFIELLQAMDEVWILGLGNDHGGRAAAQARACGARVVAVDVGGLARYADVLVPCQAGAIAEAALSPRRRAMAIESPSAIAERIINLYRSAGGDRDR
jgi:L-malate glycosyltransferase